MDGSLRESIDVAEVLEILVMRPKMAAAGASLEAAGGGKNYRRRRRRARRLWRASCTPHDRMNIRLRPRKDLLCQSGALAVRRFRAGLHHGHIYIRYKSMVPI